VSHAFHSPLMEPIAGPLLEVVEGMELRPPSTGWRVVSTLTGGWCAGGELTRPSHWVEHALRPVQFLIYGECGMKLI
jgi:acyl transferase domain-containing protein